MQYFMGIDVGTQSIRVSLFDENLSVAAFNSTPQFINVSAPGRATQNPDFWWDAVCSGISSLIKRSNINPADIVSVGCCAHMHGVVPVDKNGEVLDKNAQLYCDKRTDRLVEMYRASNYTDEIHKITGNVPASNWQGLKIKWLKENSPRVYEAAYKFLTPKDFINFKLTDNFYTDPSEASGTMAMDASNDNWRKDLFNLLDIDGEKMPDIAPSFSVIGKISEQTASKTGLNTETSVAAGAGDMPTSMYLCGIYKGNIFIDQSATTGVIAGYSDSPVFDKRLQNLRCPNSGWIVFRSTDGSGATLRWLKDNVAAEKTAEAEKNGINAYDFLTAEALKTSPGAENLIFLPHFLGERSMGSMRARGAFLGLDLNTSLPQMSRAVLEGVAFELKRSIDALEDNNLIGEAVYHISGGAKSPAWSQIKADIYNKPVYTLKGSEDSVLGAALIGAVAAGYFSSPEEAAERVFALSDAYYPNPENKSVYEDLYQIFCGFHDAVEPVYEKMNVR